MLMVQKCSFWTQLCIMTCPNSKKGQFRVRRVYLWAFWALNRPKIRYRPNKKFSSRIMMPETAKKIKGYLGQIW